MSAGWAINDGVSQWPSLYVHDQVRLYTTNFISDPSAVEVKACKGVAQRETYTQVTAFRFNQFVAGNFQYLTTGQNKLMLRHGMTHCSVGTGILPFIPLGIANSRPWYVLKNYLSFMLKTNKLLRSSNAWLKAGFIIGSIFGIQRNPFWQWIRQLFLQMLKSGLRIWNLYANLLYFTVTTTRYQIHLAIIQIQWIWT